MAEEPRVCEGNIRRPWSQPRLGEERTPRSEQDSGCAAAPSCALRLWRRQIRCRALGGGGRISFPRLFGSGGRGLWRELCRGCARGHEGELGGGQKVVWAQQSEWS